MSESRILVGRYRLISKLGSGGMGSVWRAHDLNLNADVAVKLIDPRYASSPEALARFRREAQAAAAIRSTYVVQILDHGIDCDTPFIAMELLNGESLAQRIDRLGRLDPNTTARILSQVGRALSLAHENDIVHRDMKPDNVFLVREGDEDVGKVLDFGVARARSLGESGAGLTTETGMVLGTPYYMSPEQANGQPLDALTDIWSFAIIACECLTGKRAFTADSLPALFHAICMAPHPTPSSLGPVPPGFDAWFRRAAARDKQQRFQSIRQAADELRAVCLAAGAPLADIASIPSAAESAARPRIDTGTVTSVQVDFHPSPSGGVSLAPRRRSGARALGIAAIGAAVIGAVALGVHSWSGEAQPSGSASVGPVAAAAPSGASLPVPPPSSALVPADPAEPQVLPAPTPKVAPSAPSSLSVSDRPRAARPAQRSAPTVAPTTTAPPRPKQDDNASGI